MFAYCLKLLGGNARQARPGSSAVGHNFTGRGCQAGQARHVVLWGQETTGRGGEKLAATGTRGVLLGDFRRFFQNDVVTGWEGLQISRVLGRMATCVLVLAGSNVRFGAGWAFSNAPNDTGTLDNQQITDT